VGEGRWGRKQKSAEREQKEENKKSEDLSSLIMYHALRIPCGDRQIKSAKIGG
jgi:hypothetical protein